MVSVNALDAVPYARSKVPAVLDEAVTRGSRSTT